MTLEPAGLFVEAPQRAELLVASELRLRDRRLPHLDGFVQHLERHRERMPVLAAVSQREAAGIAEPARGAVHHFGHHRQRADGPCTHAGREQEFGKIRGSAVGRGGQIAVQPSRHDIFGANLMVCRHDEMRQQRLRRNLCRPFGTFQPREFAHDPVRPQRSQQVELRATRFLRAPVGKIDDLSLAFAFDRSVRIVQEAGQSFRQPMIAPCLPALTIHALLDHRPVAVVGDDEAMQVEIEAVLHGGAVDLGDETAELRQLTAVEADLVSDRDQLARGVPRVFPAPAADVDAQLLPQRRQPALERADHARRDAGRMPVHPHDRAEGLKPKRIGQAAQKLVAPVVMNDGLGHHRTQPGHAVRQPFRHLSAVQRQIRTARPSRHRSHIPWMAARSPRRRPVPR